MNMTANYRPVIFALALVLLPVLLPILMLLWLVRIYKKRMNPPTNDREWYASNREICSATFVDRKVHIHNIRNMSYDQWQNLSVLPPGDLENSEYHFQHTYNMDAIESLFFGFTHGHMFLTFVIGTGIDTEHLTFSVEHRHDFKKAPELTMWNYLTGAFTLYPIMCAEHDIFYRSMAQEAWPYPLMLYPIRDLKSSDILYERRLIHRLLFLRVLQRVNQVAGVPEHYDALTNMCLTNTATSANLALRSISQRNHIKCLWPQSALRYLMYSIPGIEHQLFKHDFIDLTAIPRPNSTQLSFDEVRNYCDISTQLTELVKAGVSGSELAFKVRERFSKGDG